MRDKNSRKILLIMPYGSVGGMERLATTFYKHYKKQGMQVSVLKFIQLREDLISFGDDEFYLSRKDFNQMSFIQRYILYLKAPLKIRKIVKLHKIEYTIAFGDMANLFSSLSFTHEFKIGSIHALKSIELSNATSFNNLTRLGYRSSYKKLNKLVCISKAIKKDLVENCNYRFNNLKVIYNPHDIENIVTRSRETLDNKKEEILFSGKCILFLGRLSVQKAPWHLLQAFKNVVKEHPETCLIFIGDGDKQVKDYLNKQIHQFNLDKHVYFLGRRSNPYKYLARATCLALSSYYEGTPNVIVEAIATGTPVVSSFCTMGILELMSVDDELKYDNKSLLKLEAGFITPSLYKGSLKVPNELVMEATKEEIYFAEGLKKVLVKSQTSKLNIHQQNQLLEKFDLSKIAQQYLEK